MFKSVNPFNQSVMATYSLSDSHAVQQKLEVASEAYKNWRKQSFSVRATLMNRAANNLLEFKNDYARTISLEMGKTFVEAVAEIEKSASACKYFAQQSEVLLADKTISTEFKQAYVSYHPTGAVLGIMPWNFPFWQVFRFAVPTLMGGNVALLKHAPNVCGTAQVIERIFNQAGFPEGVFQSLIIDVDQVEPIIQHDFVQGVSLTGSEYAGSQVAALAGKHIKKTVLELGGSDPFIVLEDADVEKAARIGVQSRMQNAGQSCIAAKRFIVAEKIYHDFTERFVQHVLKLIQGNPLDEAITTGPMARLDLAEKLEQQMNNSIEAGATLITGGKRDGCNFLPTVLTHVVPGMRAFNEETFGPLAAITMARNEQEAIELANATRYGLGASLWTRNLEKAVSLAQEINAGSVYINSLMRSDVRLPFGGIKKSGYGRELAEQGIKEFLNTKTVLMER
jgi:succinate-semialdehyde dehydrogenase / glutarate-semialdehyde dehydrogenase